MLRPRPAYGRARWSHDLQRGHVHESWERRKPCLPPMYRSSDGPPAPFVWTPIHRVMHHVRMRSVWPHTSAMLFVGSRAT